MAQPSSSPKYDVFVSHAGEDKETMAKPLRKMLKEEHEITAFVDENDIPPGGSAIEEMTSAMESADIAVIILSPEFVAKKWPMKELLFFLSRREKARANGSSLPVIIPVFYRLSIEDMYKEPNLERRATDGRSLYLVTRFFERRDNGEPEADFDIIREALRTLHGIMGVENKYHASNEISSAPSRLLLLEDTRERISQALTEHGTENEGTSSTSAATDKFQRCLHTEPLANVVLDFDDVDKDGIPRTHEGRIKRRMLHWENNSERVVAILGGGGVGKSTILKGLANDGDLRQHFRDGIHMLSLGQDATDIMLFRELCKILRDSGAKRIEERLRRESDVAIAIREALHEAKSWFRMRRCVFLIDDVWTNKINSQLFSQLFQMGGPGQQNTVLFTTREVDVAANAQPESIFHVSPRKEQGPESRKILFHHAGVTGNSANDEGTNRSITEVLRICSGLPMSLAAAGKGVKMLTISPGMSYRHAWRDYLTTVQKSREQLLRRNVSDYGNLYITFGASIALLERRQTERLGFETPASFGEMYRRLCVLEKQQKVPATMLTNLWELNSEEEARDVGMQFVEVSLAESEYEGENENQGHSEDEEVPVKPGTGRTIGEIGQAFADLAAKLERRVYGKRVWFLRIHDSLHDYATAEAKRHGDEKDAHEILLDGYRRSHPGLWSPKEGPWTDWGERKWWSEHLEDKWYVIDNLPRHLKKAERRLPLWVENELPSWVESERTRPWRSVERAAALPEYAFTPGMTIQLLTAAEEYGVTKTGLSGSIDKTGKSMADAVNKI